MTSIRGTLRAGLIFATLAAFTAAGLATDQGVRRTLLDDLDRSLRERGQWVASTIELSPEGLELGFKELEMREFESASGASVLQLWSSDGTVLYRSPSLGSIHLARPAATIPRERFGLEATADGRRLRTLHFRFVSRVDPDLVPPPPAPAVELILGRDLAGVNALMGRLHVVLFIVGLLAAALMLVILRAAVRRSLIPLDRLAAEIEDLSPEDLSRRAGTADLPTELEPMVRRLNNLLDRLHAAFERERTFSADIAHELRTPLAGLRNSLEVELSRPREPERYRESMRGSLAITLRMQELTQALLLLARLDSGLAAVEPAATDLAGLTRKELDPLRARAAQRRLELHESTPVTATIRTDPSLLGTLVRNLLDNAISHADEGGKIRVEVSLTTLGAQLIVANTGASVPQQDVPRLFDRFVRGDVARTSDGGHHGLGLALVRRIGEALGCRMEVRSEPGGEFVVTLDVPGEGISGPRAVAGVVHA